MEDITRLPAASTLKEPSLVNILSLPLLTMKKASPVIRISNGLLVVSAEPGSVIFVLMDAILTPKPTCFGLTPPIPVLAFGPDALLEF